MIGIAGCSVYIPRHRLPREAIAQAWGGRALPGSKAVGNFDEDALTMAHAAVSQLGSAPPDRLYFASTTSPYWQRSAASQIAAASDWGPETATADFGGSLRCGFSALLAGFDALASGSAKEVIVAASDRRDAPPESADETAFGDAAAALRIGDGSPTAELIASVSRSDDFLDEWRRDADDFVHSYASKYSLTRGFESNVIAAAKSLLSRAGIEASGISFLALTSPDGRSQVSCAKALGIAPDRVCDGSSAEAGVTGTPAPLIALAQALQSAKPNDLILAIAYGDGADAVLLRVVAQTEVSWLRETNCPTYRSYALYRKSREYMRQEDRGPEISNVLWKKEERQNIRLHGTKCAECGTVQFPITRVCTACRNSEGLLEIPLGRTGRVFTFTKDYLWDAPVQPTVMAVVELNGGGRFLCQMTDFIERDVRIEMPVELVLRRLREGGQNHHYYWKCRPVE